MSEGHKDMDRQRLDSLLDAYGADPARWPAAERSAAQALLASDPAAQARLAQARLLDRALDVLPPAPAPAGDLAARIRNAARQPVTPAIPLPAPANTNSPWRFTAALAASAVIGLWLGFAAPVASPFTSGGSTTIDLAAIDQQDVAALAFGPLAGQNGTGDTSYD